MAKTIIRSPNYPTISLKEAVARVKSIYAKERLHPAPRESLARDLGYKGLNGASASVLSALAKYGLLIAAGPDQFKVSSDGQNIVLHETGEVERIQAIQRAALRPTLFNDLHGVYGDDLPSDHTVSVYLQKKNFNPNTVGNVIRVFRDTMEFVTAETQAFDATADRERVEEELPVMMPSTRPQQAVTAYSGSAQPASSGFASALSQEEPDLSPERLTLSFKLAEDTLVRTEFVGRVTQEAIGKFIQLLQVSQDTFPTKSQPKQGELFPADKEE